MRVREAVGPPFADQDFVDLIPRRGQPAWPPYQLAMVSVLQFVEGLSDARRPLRCAGASTGSFFWG